jgi:hypothetical protein
MARLHSPLAASRARLSRGSLVGSLLVAWVAFACGSDAPAGGGNTPTLDAAADGSDDLGPIDLGGADGGNGDTSDGGPLDGADTTPPDVVDTSEGDQGGGGVGDACSSAADCLPSLVCDPATDTCAAELGCETHADCGVAGVCLDGTCAPNEPGGPCDGSGDCVATELCALTACVPAGCEAEYFHPERVSPNMLVLLDRSGSMVSNTVPGTGGQTRWDVGRAAVAEMVATFGDEIRFGLGLFPGNTQSPCTGSSCSPSPVHVAIGEETAETITDFMAGASTCSLGTPIRWALEGHLTYEGLADPSRRNYILLVTDGAATCSNGNPVPAVTAHRERSPEVRTFVVGFGGGVDATQLTNMAVAGGTARAESPAYYQADDAEGLTQAFAEISGRILSCVYELGSPLLAPELLRVYVDDLPVTRDTSQVSGFDVDDTQITFYGEPCELLRAGTPLQVLAVIDCDAGPKD